MATYDKRDISDPGLKGEGAPGQGGGSLPGQGEGNPPRSLGTGPKGAGSEGVMKMFDSVTPRYDLMNRVLSLGRDLFWRRALAGRAITISYPGSFLDMATGSGDQLLALRDFWPYSELVGLDFSEAMLNLARRKIEEKLPEEREISLILGDVYKAPFETESFDSVSISFGLRNLPDRPGLYREVLKLLKPGGRFLVLELYFDQRTFWAPIQRFYLQKLTPLIASGLFKDKKKAYSYLSRTVLNFPHPAHILSEMEEAGFKTLEYETFTFQSCMLVWGHKPISA
jgi:demethylmenaquinone methyltransferase/2-methoxy-6-polyprenyl-1,4-benzoquinol methylase